MFAGRGISSTGRKYEIPLQVEEIPQPVDKISQPLPVDRFNATGWPYSQPVATVVFFPKAQNMGSSYR